MKIIVFDTETTGFMNKKEIDNLEVQPYLVQFAWIYWEIKEDGTFEEIKRIDQLVKPKIPIPFGSSQVHHIYDIDVKNAPDISEVMDDFLEILNEADFVVGHNIEYDEFIINTELKRLNRYWEYNPRWVVCTMKETVEFVAVKWNWERFKYPKLWELHKKLFWDYFMWAHDAMVDVEATLRSALELNKLWVISLDNSQNSVMSLF